MKTIQIKWKREHSPLSANPYYTPNPTFSWFGKKEGGNYKQVTAFHGCRETFSNEIRRKLAINYSEGQHKDMTLKYLRILVLRRTQKNASVAVFKKELANQNRWMRESVRMLNVLERKLGWSLTRLYRVEDETLGGRLLSKERVFIHALTGSAKWLRSSQLLSLYTLFVRLGRFHKDTKVFRKLGDLGKLADALNKVPKKEGQGSRDVKYLNRIKKHLEKILDHRQELFFNRTLYQNHRLNDGFKGISAFMSGNVDTVLKDKWNKIKRAKTKG